MQSEKEILKTLKGKKILIATLPVDGHFNPLTGLAKYLQEAGCDIAWYTSDKYADKLKSLGIHHFPFVRGLEYHNFNDVYPERSSITDLIERINFDIIRGVVNQAPLYYDDIEELHTVFPFELVLADSLFPAMPLLRFKMRMTVASIGVIPLPIAGDGLAPYGMALLPATTEEERVKYQGMRRASEEVMFKPSIDAFKRVFVNYGVEVPNRNKGLMDMLVAQANIYLQIGVPSFEYERAALSDHIRYIGALYPYSRRRTGKTWFDPRLNKYMKIVLVTQGTVEGDIEKLLVPTLDAFKDTDVLVVATTGGSQTTELRARFPYENIIVENYIPFGDVMPYADVFVTNGGYGGVLLSISHELPMVAAGVFEHKNEICARIGYFHLGIDLRTETPKSADIRAAVDKVLEDESYGKSVRRLADEIRTYDGIRLAAGYIAELVSNLILE